MDVIHKRVPLTAKGREYVACCPFHDENTPSFTVSPAKQFYHCFGCGASGTAIGFLMNYANLSFVEAVEELADDLGMDVPREGGPRPKVPPGESTEQLLGILQEAREWFQQQLRQHSDAKPARQYLASRGLDQATCIDFGIGFSPPSWDALLSALGTSPVRQNQLLKVGLISQKQGSGSSRYYDRFRGRIIFPIADHRGRVVAFGGRVLGDETPKYLNSPETLLFHKGQELYGLHRGRRSIGQEGRSIVVEGYMDVVSLAQFGMQNVVGTLGTATTRAHLKRLFRLAPDIVFCFDGDRAGRDAAWRALQVALPEMQDGRQLGFLFLPDGEDPDTFVRAGGGVETFLQKVREDAMPLDRFLFDTLTAQSDLTRMDGKARLVSLVRPLIETIPGGALKQLMQAQLSELTGLPPDQFMQAASRAAPLPPRRMRGRPSPMATAISLLLQYPAAAGKISRLDVVNTFRQQGADHLQQIVRCIQQDPKVTTARLLEVFRDSTVQGYLGQLATHDHQVTEDTVVAFLGETLARVQQQQDEERITELLQQQSASDRKLSRKEARELRILLDQKKARRAP